jgi:hypothetical protein
MSVTTVEGVGRVPGDGDGPVLVTGAAIAFRLFDVGYAIDLARAAELLAGSAPERVRPLRGEGQALQIPNTPLTVALGTEPLAVDGGTLRAELSARLFDFGVVSVRARVTAPAALPWEAFGAFGSALRRPGVVDAAVEPAFRTLVHRISPAIERPQVADVREDYVVFRITSVTDGAGTAGAAGARATARAAERDPEATAALLARLDVAPLLLQETRPLSPEARRELLPHRFSYYRDDLAVLTWESALVVDAEAGDTDLEYILEFANAQLLELRYYDSLLDAELPRLYDDIAAARRRYAVFPGRRFASVLSRLSGQVADLTELVERAENALKVTDDVYLARVYSAALELFRGRAWRAGIDRKLAILRDTYTMLNDETQAARSETLEMAIVALIVVEVVMGFLRY